MARSEGSLSPIDSAAGEGGERERRRRGDGGRASSCASSRGAPGAGREGPGIAALALTKGAGPRLLLGGLQRLLAAARQLALVAPPKLRDLVALRLREALVVLAIGARLREVVALVLGRHGGSIAYKIRGIRYACGGARVGELAGF
jgi:hypothetical protein